MKYLFIPLILSLVLCSCSYYRYGAVPKVNVAGQSISENEFSIKDYEIKKKDVKGQDSFSIILFFPIIAKDQAVEYGMISNAVQKVCKEEDLAFMTNVKVYVNVWYIPLIYGQVTIKVEGEGWQKNQQTKLINELEKLGYFCQPNYL